MPEQFDQTRKHESAVPVKVPAASSIKGSKDDNGEKILPAQPVVAVKPDTAGAVDTPALSSLPPAAGAKETEAQVPDQPLEPGKPVPAMTAAGSSVTEGSAAEVPAEPEDNTSSPVAAGTPGDISPMPLVTASDYVIGPGDLLDISVWKDEALTRTVVVLPDGKITFPLAGDLLAGGRTIPELKQEIAGRLERYVPELVLSVEVKQSNSMLIYIIGRVNAPGRQVLNTNVNVLQALSMAGGLNPFASKDKIRVFRSEQGWTRIIPFRYSEVIDGTNLADNIVLKRGDVIVVP